MISSRVSFDKPELVFETMSLTPESTFSLTEEEIDVTKTQDATPYIAGFCLCRLCQNFMTEKSSYKILYFLFVSADNHLVVNRYFTQVDLGTWFEVCKVENTKCLFPIAETQMRWVRIWTISISNVRRIRSQPIHGSGLGLISHVCVRCI